MEVFVETHMQSEDRQKRMQQFIDNCTQHFIVCSVVTQFWTPRAEDSVYLFWTECRSLAHIHQKIDKGT
jgi:hypothetical protein